MRGVLIVPVARKCVACRARGAGAVVSNLYVAWSKRKQDLVLISYKPIDEYESNQQMLVSN